MSRSEKLFSPAPMLGLISAMPKSYIIKHRSQTKKQLNSNRPIPDTIVIGKNKPGAEAVELY